MNKDYLKISERIIEMTGVDIFQNTRKTRICRTKGIGLLYLQKENEYEVDKYC